MSEPKTMQDLMDQIRQENPEYWPYRLRVGSFDNVYPIHKGDALVGFTAWQFRHDDDTGKEIGYYAVGVLPGHRRQGLAERALKRMITEKPKRIDQVRAYVVEGNAPSLSLAAKLKVPVQHKSASLHESAPSSKVAAMPRDLAPTSHLGLALQSYLPVVPRRDSFTQGEKQEMEAGKDQWFSQVFRSMADSPAVDMSSPGKGALMGGLGGGAAGAALGHIIAGSPAAAATGGGLGALLGALAAYHSRSANNTDVEEQMRRIPPNGTRRDVLADPVLQAQLNRDTTMRAAMASGGVKFSGILDGLAKFIKSPAGVGTMGTAGGTVAYDALMHPDQMAFWNDPDIKTRLSQMAMNTAFLGAGATLGGRAGKPKPKQPAKQVEWTQNQHRNIGAGLIGSAALLPGKDLAQANMNTGHALTSALSDMAGAMKDKVAPAPTSLQQIGDLMSKNKLLTAGAGLGIGGLAVGAGMLANKGINALRGLAKKDDHGRIRVTLPTRKPGDAETQLDLPIQDIPISNAMFGRLRRDFRNRVHTETKERTRKVVLSDEEKRRRGELLNRLRYV